MARWEGTTGWVPNPLDMAIMSDSRPGQRSFSAFLDIESEAEEIFALLCAVEKWPAWLSFVRCAELTDANSPLAVGSEIVIRSTLSAEEQLYEVEQLIPNYLLSLVGAYSVRKRLELRIERKTTRARVHIRLAYPAYHGAVGSIVDRLRTARKVDRMLDEALVHLKGMVERYPLAVVDGEC
jgi:uncharacterized membrane protein